MIIPIIFSIIVFQSASFCVGYENVTFESGMQEGDVIELRGRLSSQSRPFLVELASVDQRNYYLRFFVQGVRRRFEIRSTYPGLVKKVIPSSTVQRGSEFKFFLRFHNNALIFEYNEKHVMELPVNHPIRIANIRGQYKRAAITKAKWYQYYCNSAPVTNCGRTIYNSRIEKGLCQAKVVGPLQRIVGGAPSNAGEHPWQVSFRKRDANAGEHPHVCGGVLIDSCWVLSAAHCFIQDSASDDFVVRVGDYYNRDDTSSKYYKSYENSEEFKIKQVHRHYQFWTYPQPRYDIALVHLKSKTGDGRCAQFGSFVQPICLPTSTEEFIPPQECVITGWGATKFKQDKREYPGCLQQAGVFLIRDSRCKYDYPDNKAGPIILDSMQCAEAPQNNGRADSCQGDSGGPLTCTPNSGSQAGRSVVWGLTSFGDECGKMYGVYTKVASFLDWIQEEKKKMCKFNPFEQ
ncbi:tryptase gamma-like [Styela clava]|uniref:urokinase-type plasminogen activator-like n=1 Tax=Styela clava TaxID=7725 RepID=UPI00193988F2|nr:urokinase-type plasminogen activator-like [Styela clava]